MRLWFWPAKLTILVDFGLWLVIHLSVSCVVAQIPATWFSRHSSLFKTWRWEQGGRIYRTVFAIQLWKDLLPDGGVVFAEGFSKRRLTDVTKHHIERFIAETRRAELAHLLQIPPVVLFFLFNETWVGWCMIGYAVAVNAPCILAQRYNRPRLQQFAKQIHGD